MNNLLDKLKGNYKNHQTIIVGVDFDNTIYPLDRGREEVCKAVRELLVRLQPFATLCLYTVADEWTLPYKRTIASEMYELNFEYFNESPLSSRYPTKKPYFNVLLDDKAGLPYVYDVLDEFIEWAQTIKTIEI